MFKKIILPVVLLIFTHQEFYGMKRENEDSNKNIWRTINCLVNMNHYTMSDEFYPKLWWLWAILDNVPFQYGNSKIWKHGEAYYGLSNGIGFFPSFLNFGWLKIGFGDAHINVINLILDYFKSFVQRKTENNLEILPFLLLPIGVNSYFNIHIFSFKILNCIKIKLIAPLILVYDGVGNRDDEEIKAWYITCNADKQISWWYGLLSPRIEINIPGIIDYFKVE